jgi:hypothetical protein
MQKALLLLIIGIRKCSLRYNHGLFDDNKWWTGKDVEVSGSRLIETESRYFPGGFQEKHENSQSG